MSEITELAGKLFNPKAEYRAKIIPVAKHIRGHLDHTLLFSTTSALLVWEHKWFPAYWIPRKAFVAEATFTSTPSISGIQTSTAKLSLKNGGKTIDALIVPEGFNTPLAGYVKVSFDALDAWFEEQTQLQYHPKDPFHRVDVLPTDRAVRVELNGVVLADTKSGGGVMSLWETGFPARWYLPRTAVVDWSYLVPSEKHTGCPYKGEASYYHIKLPEKSSSSSSTSPGKEATEIQDAVWWYRSPIKECNEIIGMLCFYPDKVDYFIDGVKAGQNGMPLEEVVDGDGVNGGVVKVETGVEDPTREVRAHQGHEDRSCNC